MNLLDHTDRMDRFQHTLTQSTAICILQSTWILAALFPWRQLVQIEDIFVSIDCVDYIYYRVGKCQKQMLGFGNSMYDPSHLDYMELHSTSICPLLPLNKQKRRTQNYEDTYVSNSKPSSVGNCRKEYFMSLPNQMYVYTYTWMRMIMSFHKLK